MASTKKMESKVHLSTTNNKPFPISCSSFPKGPHHNIFNREEGMPKPPRVENMASTTTTHPRVSYPHCTCNEVNFYTHIELSLTGLYNSLPRDDKTTKVPRVWGIAVKEHKDQIHLKPHEHRKRSRKLQTPVPTTGHNKEEVIVFCVNPPIYLKTLPIILIKRILSTGPRAERSTYPHHILPLSKAAKAIDISGFTQGCDINDGLGHNRAGSTKTHLVQTPPGKLIKNDNAFVSFYA